MTRFSTPPKSSRQILMLTAGIFLLGATEGALARDRGNSNDHGGMRSGDSGRDRDHGDRHSEKREDKNSALREVRRENDKGGDKHAEKQKDKNRDGDKHAEKNRDKDRDGDKHAEKTKDKDRDGDRHAEKSKDKDQDKTTGTTTTSNTPAADGGHVLMDSGIVGRTPTDIVRIPIDPGTGGKPAETATNGGTIPIDPGTGGKMPGDRGNGDKHAEKHKDDKDGDKHAEKQKDKDKDKAAGTTTANSTTPAADGGHVLMDSGIVGKTPTDIVPIDPGTGGKASAGGQVTVSNGVDTYEIPNGPGGVAVYSGSPGTITITNGKESKTLNGGSVTLSGNVVGIGAAQNVQVGARNGEGRTTIAIRPVPTDAKPPVPTSSGHVTTGDGSITVSAKDVAKTAAKVWHAVPIVTFIPPAAAAYGLAKGGVKGAVNGVKDAAKGLYKFFSW